MKKQLWILTVSILLSMNVGADEIITGACGDNLTCEFDRTTGVLTISGTGDMWDFYLNEEGNTNAPWSVHRADLKTVIMEYGVTSIGLQAFNACQSLTEITMAESVTSIGNSAFYACTSLTSIVFPKNVSNIGTSIFYWNSVLSEITVKNPIPPTVSDRTFYGIYKSLNDITLIVPAGKKEVYQTTPVWQDFDAVEEQDPASYEPYLYIEKTDGTLLEYLFTNSEIEVIDNQFKIITPTNQHIFDYNDVLYFQFTLKNNTGIEDISANGFSVKIYLNKENTLYISAEQPLQFVQIFDTMGRLIETLKTNETSVNVDMSDVPRGVYLIKTAAGSGKIIR